MYKSSTTVCQTCLSQDRFLYPVKMFNYSLRQVNISILQQDSGICWECRSIVTKFLKFKNQIKEAQRILSHKPKNLKSLSKLKISGNVINHTLDYDDPLTHDTPLETVSDANSDDLKQDTDDAQENNGFDTSQDTDIEKAYVCEEPEEEETNTKDIEEYKDKYTLVVYNEEEVIRIREKKRNQPGFKKLPFKCDTCVLGFTRKETFDVHMHKKHSEPAGEYLCDICDMRFSTYAKMTRHKSNHYLSYRCNFCKYTTLQLYAILTHCKLKHPNDKLGVIYCNQCTSTAETPEEMAAHIQMEHTLHCSECGQKFKGKDTLRRHKARIHTTMRDFVCDICKKAFKTRSRLESHLVRHNTAIAKRLAYCGVCNVQYTNIYVYRSHLRNSHNHSERLYPCSHCSKSFVSKVYRRRHCEFYHFKKFGHKCELCNRLFMTPSRLKAHKQAQHGLSRTRDHSCEKCGKKFYNRRTLICHQLTHSEQRSFMCETCGDTFKQRPALYNHNKIVHKGLNPQ